MVEILKGKAVADSMNEDLKKRIEALAKNGIIPTLAILRVGEKADDIVYEIGAVKRAETVGVNIKKFLLAEDVSQEELIKTIESINENQDIHGLLLFRPLPNHIDDEKIRDSILPAKDIDGITQGSMAGVYGGIDLGFPPCTAKACMEILDYYNIDVKGKNVAIVGRSLVIGRPVAMMILNADGTPTICHTKTDDLSDVCRRADILIAAVGKEKSVGLECFSEGQTVIDVGINVREDGSMVGDVDFEAAKGIVKAITPVPGGVGTVTTSTLMKHVVASAEKKQ